MTIATFPATMKKVTFGRLLREERESHPNHTQGRCAYLIGYTRRQWIHWEADECFPSGIALKLLFGLYPNLKVKFASPEVHLISSKF